MSNRNEKNDDEKKPAAVREARRGRQKREAGQVDQATTTAPGVVPAAVTMTPLTAPALSQTAGPAGDPTASRTTSAPPLAGAESLLATAVLERTARSGRGGLDRARLAADLGDEALATAAELLARGELVEIAGRLIAPASLGLVAGTLIALPSGDALVRIDGSSEARYYVRAAERGEARAGDRVLLEPEAAAGAAKHGDRRGGGRPTAGRASARGGRDRLPNARVRGVGQRALARVVGTVRLGPAGPLTAGRPVPLLEPFDLRTEEVLRLEPSNVAPDLSALDGIFVVAEFPPAPPGRLPVGRVSERLGSIETPGTDVLAILRHHQIPEDFPPDALAEAAGLAEDPPPADWAGRLDLRATSPPIVTIDGESARDFDDAVAAKPLPGGGYRVAVHIADVAHYVRPGSALDRAAYQRGTSVYFPDRAVPMLPERLSNGLCSLRPGVPRLALSVFFDVDAEGNVTRPQFAQSVIQSARRLTYGEVHRLLEQPAADDVERYGAVLPAVQQLAAAAALLQRRRMARGSLDFDLPDADVLLDAGGATVGIAPGERNVAHRLIEDLMIAANEVVAAALDGAGVPALYRVHDAPGPTELVRLQTALRGFGQELTAGPEAFDAAALQQLLARLHGRPEEALISALVLRAQQRARYDRDCRGHYALAARHYCHFTSPIRRYPDLVVHRQLSRWLAGTLAEESDLAARLDAIAEHTSNTERRAEAAERELLQWKKVRFLADRVGARFRGTVTGVTNFGLFVQLTGVLVDGLVASATLEELGLSLEPEAFRVASLRGDTTIRLGETVEVELVAVDLRRRGLNLRLLPAKAESARGPAPPPVGQREGAKDETSPRQQRARRRREAKR